MQFLLNLLRGAVIGVAEIIPGVSGGTMAVLMKVYDKLIGSISHLKKQFKKSVGFLLPLVIGMLAAIVALSHVIQFLLANYPMQVNFLFLGLILGILPMLFRKATEKKVRPAHVVPFFVTLAVMVVLACFYFTTDTSVVTQMDALQFLRFMAVGFLAAICLMLPGISGSMVMVIFGIYSSVIAAVSSMHLVILVPVAIGILLGLAFGSKGIDFCLRHFPQPTYFAICGLVLGSAISLVQRALYPDAAGKALSLPGGGAIVASLITLAVGIGISLLFTSDRLTRGHAKKEGPQDA